MIIEIAVIAVMTVLKWLVYTALLWGMIKVQKLQYNMLGLMGSSALAILLNFIPVFGCYISWAALILCLWKVTRTDIVPDVVFTVGIAGAIMFCLNLWGFGALMGELRPDLKFSGHEEAPAIEETADDDEISFAPAQALAAARDLAEKANADLTNKEQEIALITAPAPARPAPKPLGIRSPHGLQLKGVMLTAQKPTAMIMARGKFFTLEPGEVVSIRSGQSNVSVRCTGIDKSGVSVTLNNTEEFMLRVQ